MRFLGATPSTDFDMNKQWQNYSYFTRVDHPAPPPSRAKTIVKNLNPFRRNEPETRDEPGPSNRVCH